MVNTHKLTSGGGGRSPKTLQLVLKPGQEALKNCGTDELHLLSTDAALGECQSQRSPGSEGHRWSEDPPLAQNQGVRRRSA